MYKYIIYCSVSAAIIIACKYLYQHWIRQNHTIANLKQELGILNDKVKRLENELERNKNSISGGIKIPILFKPIENRFITPPPSPKVIQLVKDEPSIETSSSSSLNEHPVTVEEQQNGSINSVKSQKEIELEQMTANLEKEIENISLHGDNIEIELEEDDQIVIEKSDKGKKSYKKKNQLPEAKDYNNGERFTDESGVEHICVVGKRGGHSWKKL